MPPTRPLAVGMKLLALVVAAAGSACQPPASTTGSLPAAAVTSSQRTAARVEVQRDAATGTTVVRLAPAEPPSAARGRPQLVAGVSWTRTEDAPRAVLLGLRATGSSWRYEGCRSLRLRAAGQAPTEGAAQRETQLGRGQLTEVVFAMLPLAAVRQASGAPHVSIELCEQHRIELDATDLALLRQLLQRLDRALAGD